MGSIIRLRVASRGTPPEGRGAPSNAPQMSAASRLADSVTLWLAASTFTVFLSPLGSPREGHEAQRKASPIVQRPHALSGFAASFCSASAFSSAASSSALPQEQFLQALLFFLPPPSYSMGPALKSPGSSNESSSMRSSSPSPSAPAPVVGAGPPRGARGFRGWDSAPPKAWDLRGWAPDAAAAGFSA